jgi:MerR family transcriptional regulator, aldehyde-responsive regulator
VTPTDLLDATDLSIGELATLTGLSVHTLRYYEKIGLIEPVPRLDSGHRRYSRETVIRAEALSYLRATGLGVEDVRRYLRSVDQGDSAAADVAELLATHAERIADEIKRLEVRQAYIAAKASYWRAVADGRGDSPAAQRSLQQARDLSGVLT